MLKLETRRLILRQFAKTDAKAASHNSTRPIVARFMSDMVLETEEEARGWIAWVATKCNIHEPCMVLAMEPKNGGEVIGLIGVAPKKELNNEIEILFSVADEHQGNGYATEAGEVLIRWAFDKAGLKRLSAIVKPANAASCRVIEKLGFEYVDTRTLPYDGENCAFDYFTLDRK